MLTNEGTISCSGSSEAADCKGEILLHGCKFLVFFTKNQLLATTDDSGLKRLPSYKYSSFTFSEQNNSRQKQQLKTMKCVLYNRISILPHIFLRTSALTTNITRSSNFQIVFKKT